MKQNKTIQDIQQPTEKRKANYSLLKIFKKFEQVSDYLSDGTCGNIQWKINGDFDLESMVYKGGLFNGKAFYEVVSSPMLLARLVSAGLTPKVFGQEGYKVTWSFVLKHKSTGRIVTFYDYKGAASVGSCMSGLEEEKFLKDVFTLCKALSNVRFPHPYDGCVVGEIA